MIHLIAYITAQPGKRAELLKAFHTVIPDVRAEPGCIEYAPAVDADDFPGVAAPIGPDTYAVVEKWASAEALRAHMAAPHMKEYAARTKHLIAGRVLHVMREG